MGISKRYELVYSNSAKINMGDFEQLAPFYSTKILIESDMEIDVRAEYEALRNDVDTLLRLNIDNIKNAKKAKDVGNFRFYEKDGKKFVSVTSILNPEPKTPEQEAFLKPYGDRGTSLHRQFQHLIENGKLSAFTEEEKNACASVGGFLGYEFWFKEDKRFDFSIAEVSVYNEKELYAGRYDSHGFFDNKTAMFDLKSGSLDKAGIDKAKMQLAAYNDCLDEPKEVLVIIPIGPKAKKEPIVVEGEEIKKYFGMFMAKRNEFKQRYNV